MCNKEVIPKDSLKEEILINCYVNDLIRKTHFDRNHVFGVYIKSSFTIIKIPEYARYINIPEYGRICNMIKFFTSRVTFVFSVYLSINISCDIPRILLSTCVTA